MTPREAAYKAMTEAVAYAREHGLRELLLRHRLGWLELLANAGGLSSERMAEWALVEIALKRYGEAVGSGRIVREVFRADYADIKRWATLLSLELLGEVIA